MSDEKLKELRGLLEKEPEVLKEYEDLQSLWEFLDYETPTPSMEMDKKFYEILRNDSTSQNNETKEIKVNWFEKALKSRLGYAAILFICFLSGALFQKFSNGSQDEVKAELQQMKKMMMLTLMDQPEAQERIRAVNMYTEVSTTDQRILGALINTLNNDANVNVRLSVIEVLSQREVDAETRQALVKSLATQDNPLVQVALADLMVILQEKSAINTLEEILENESTDPLVKEKVKESIDVII